jgi:YggT family protein
MDVLFGLIGQALYIYSWVLIIYVLLSWFGNARESTFGQFLGSICEPYLEPFRKIIPPIGMMDISPLVAFFVLRLAGEGVRSLSYMF